MMEGKFQTYLDHSATPNPPSSFAGDVHSPFANGFDLDPIFLEESWTLGVLAASRNALRRRQLKADREYQSRVLHELRDLGTQQFVEDRQRAEPPQSWTPHNWLPDDRITQSSTPQGWTPRDMPQRESPQPECHGTMTIERACLLLEVTPSSTRGQIRSAYRRMVGQWHPDRLQFTTEAVRNHATRHMAHLNEAYGLLRTTEFQQAA